jgi:HEPN domain-containing protein
MKNTEFDRDKIVNYWLDSSDDDFDTMMAMFESKRYSWSLFIGHLMIEKLLKALYVKINNEFSPFSHNLLRLAEKCKLDLKEEETLFFVTVTAFNINARYDDYKMSFQKTCTPEFSAKWLEEIKMKRLWIKEFVKQ